MVPLLGDAVDLGRCGVGVATGDHDTDTALTCAAAVPLLGTAATGTKLTVKAVGHADDLLDATRATNKIFSAQQLIRQGDNAADAFHNFPGSYDDQIFEYGERTVVESYFKKSKPLLSNDTIQYRLPGEVDGHSGVFEIFTRPSVSGRTELITHRFFRKLR